MNDLVTDEQIEVTAEVPATESPKTEQEPQKVLTVDEQIEAAEKKLKEYRDKLTFEKFELLLDESEKENIQKYLSKIQSFIHTDMNWVGYEMFAVESLMNEIKSLAKTLKEKEVPSLSFFSIETFVRLTNTTSGKGAREVAKRKSVLKAFNNTYSMINENYIQKLKDTENELTDLYNQRDFEQKERQRQEMEKIIQEQPGIDIPRTLNEINRFFGDVSGVFNNIKEQLENQLSKE